MTSRVTKPGLRALLGLAGLCALATSADAQSRQVFGYAGVLGEWELTATVAHTGTPAGDEFSGPLTMTHVGLCTQDGPEEKTGDIRLRLSPSRPQLNAVLSVGGVACTFKGNLSDAYRGLMSCPDRDHAADPLGRVGLARESGNYWHYLAGVANRMQRQLSGGTSAVKGWPPARSKKTLIDRVARTRLRRGHPDTH